MDWIRLSLRRLRDERVGTLGLVAFVLVTALAFGLAPRVLQQVSDGSLRSEVTSSASAERNLQLTRLIRFDEEVPTRVTDIPVDGAELEDEFPEVISDAIAERTWVVETPSWQVASGVPIATVVNLRIQEGAAERVRLVEGDLPTGRVASVVDDRPGVPPGSALVLVEAMMSSSAADKIGLVVGSTLLLGPDPLDPLSAGLSVGAAIKVVGTYELEDSIRPVLAGGCRCRRLAHPPALAERRVRVDHRAPRAGGVRVVHVPHPQPGASYALPVAVLRRSRAAGGLIAGRVRDRVAPARGHLPGQRPGSEPAGSRGTPERAAQPDARARGSMALRRGDPGGRGHRHGRGGVRDPWPRRARLVISPAAHPVDDPRSRRFDDPDPRRDAGRGRPADGARRRACRRRGHGRRAGRRQRTDRPGGGRGGRHRDAGAHRHRRGGDHRTAARARS